VLSRHRAIAFISAVGTPAIAKADGYGPPPIYSAPSSATADPLPSSGSTGTPWGLVPGFRIGAVHGSFEGAAGAPEGSGWGYTTEFHLDLIRTFGGDRRAIGFSLGYLSQTRNSDDVTMPDANTFQHSGVAATVMLSSVLGGRTSISARAGLVSGDTSTGAGQIAGSLTRLGIEVTHVSTFADIIDVASHLSLERFGGGDDREFTAIAVVLGATFAFGLF